MYSVSQIKRVVYLGWSDVDHHFIEWFANSGTDVVLSVALHFSSVLGDTDLVVPFVHCPLVIVKNMHCAMNT
jgi:hypothetical protein